MIEKEFNRVLDRYLWDDGHMTSEEYGAMDDFQRLIIQIIKRSRNRTTSRTRKLIEKLDAKIRIEEMS